jgi:hypothetical protein
LTKQIPQNAEVPHRSGDAPAGDGGHQQRSRRSTGSPSGCASATAGCWPTTTPSSRRRR